MTRREHNLRLRISVGSAAQAFAKIGYPAPVSGPNPPDNPIFVVRLKPQSGDGVRSLQQFLKKSLRHYQLRCFSVTEEFLPELIIEHCETADDEAWGPTLPGYADDEKFYARVGPRPGRKTRWRSISCGIHQNQQEREMNPSDLAKLRDYAAASKSQIAFGGATYIMFDPRTGKVTAGKAAIDMGGRKLGVDIPDAMGGFRQFVDRKPVYALTKVLDPNVEPIARSELGDIDKTRWLDEKDPWTGVTVLPLFDPATHEVFVLSCVYGERGAASNLIDAYADHVAAHPEAAEQLPVISFSVRQYPRNDGTPGFALQFDIETWIGRPKSIAHISPPPLTIERISNGKAADDSGTAAADSAKAKSPEDKVTKLKRKVAVPGKPDYDDSVPF